MNNIILAFLTLIALFILVGKQITEDYNRPGKRR